MFPGAEVIVRSHCRQTKEPVELLGRDGILLDYSPRTLRVQFGRPVREFAADVVGWCDYNSFFASEEAAKEWRLAHPHVKGITRDPRSVALAVTETIGKGRLEYDYQPGVPVLKMVRHMHAYGFTRPTRFGLQRSRPVLAPHTQARAGLETAGHEELRPLLAAMMRSGLAVGPGAGAVHRVDESSSRCRFRPDASVWSMYDYVIVGAGSARMRRMRR